MRAQPKIYLQAAKLLYMSGPGTKVPSLREVLSVLHRLLVSTYYVPSMKSVSHRSNSRSPPQALK